MPYTPPASRSPSSNIPHSVPVSPLTSARHHTPPGSPGPPHNLPRSRSSNRLHHDILSSPPERAGITARASGLLAEKQAATSNTLGLSSRARPRKSKDAELPADAAKATEGQTQTARQDSSDEENYAELERAVRESLQLNGAGEAPNKQPFEPDMRGSDRDSTDSEASTSQPPKLTQTARKITHSRSSTEPVIAFAPSPSQAETSERRVSSDASEDDEDAECPALKPPLIRKKSGELVRPAIRPHMQLRRKHSSMPGTPTYGKKGVHFSDNITQVKHFLSLDRPMAVSAGGSPVEGYEDELEFPFSGRQQAPTSSGAFEVRLNNFPRDTLERQSAPVRVDRIALSGDQKALLGDVVVANLAFHKSVTARFTTDAWQTTSEVVAAYNRDARKKPKDLGFDLFSFSVNLSDHASLDKKTMLMCIRYNVGGQEYWDNNSSQNYRIDFVKTQQPGLQSVNRAQQSHAIPRSRTSSTQQNQLRTKPSLDDDFGNAFDPSPFRFRQQTKNLLPDTLPARRAQPGGQQFGSRYDFGASLTAALNNAQTQLGDRSGLSVKKDSQAKVKPEPVQKTEPPRPPQKLARQVPNSSGTESPRADRMLTNKPSVDSRAYQEFVSKFCFFGSGKPASPGSAPHPPPASSKARPPSGDGAEDEQQSLPNGVQKESMARSESNSMPPPSTSARANCPLTNPGQQFYGHHSATHSGPPSPPSRLPDEHNQHATAPGAAVYLFRPNPPHSDFFAGTATPPAIRG